MQGDRAYALRLLGTFRLDGPDGTRIDIRSKRSQALIAMLALGSGGERSRAWLQTMLWTDRGPEQARASLRRELSNLRQLLNGDGDLLMADNQNVALDLSQVSTDIDDAAKDTQNGAHSAELLEGLDIPGSTAFEEWLREERQAMQGGSFGNGNGSGNGSGNAIGASPAEAMGAVPAAPSVSTPATSVPAAQSVPDEPAIAVLRFVAEPASDDVQQIAEGLAEDLIDTLSQTRWLPVISRSSSFAHASGASDPREVGAALRARYVVEGRLQWRGEAATLRVELQDAATARTLHSDRHEWSEAQDRPDMAPLLADIAAALGVRIEQEEQRLSYGKSENELQATDLIWRGRWHLNRLTDRDHDQAQALFEQALERDPLSSEARIQALWLRIRDLWRKRGSDDEIRGARREAQRAIQSNPDDGRGYMLAAITELWLGELTRAQQGFEKAIERNPSLTMAHAQLGSVHMFKGNWDTAAASHERARRLSPSDQDMFFIHGELALIHLFAGRPLLAIEHAEQSLALRAGYWYAHMVKVAAFNEIDQEQSARQALDAILLSKPGFSLSYIDWLPFEDPAHAAYLCEQLNQAGLVSD